MTEGKWKCKAIKKALFSQCFFYDNLAMMIFIIKTDYALFSLRNLRFSKTVPVIQ